MEIRMIDLIEKKKRGIELTDDEMQFFVDGAVSGDIPDYQLSAFLMAVYFNSMTDKELLSLTMKMAKSGDMADLSKINGATVDKHSTGGVGDKTTLIAAPIVASLGGKVAKMSGRGLSHTGGTIDKLEAIPNFKTSLTSDKFISQVNKIGIAVIGQSGNMASADKKLYALRDVTGTVNSIPLIASSIMSKKLAAGAGNIVLDVKYGSGAFMKTADDAELLARKMVDIGNGAGRKTVAVISSMSEPLGYNIGNALEVIEAVEVLKGGGPSDLRELCIELSSLMYSLVSGKDRDECKAAVDEVISSGLALGKFKEMIAAQGGDISFIENPMSLISAKYVTPVYAERDGYISSVDAERAGRASMLLGAGRTKKDDVIDMSAGIILKKKPGDKVSNGEELSLLFSNAAPDTAAKTFKAAIAISDTAPKPGPIILKIID